VRGCDGGYSDFLRGYVMGYVFCCNQEEELLATVEPD
jgi:hypothetical protein